MTNLKSKMSKPLKIDTSTMIVSDGTLDTQELLYKFVAQLKSWQHENSHVDPNCDDLYAKVSWFLEDFFQESYLKLPSEEALEDFFQESYDESFDLLQDIAPPGYTFGTHDGDGACFGFWELS